ncbi:MAG: hypothetical protein ACRDCV_02245, partial [Plesiomonas shigelloides]
RLLYRIFISFKDLFEMKLPECDPHAIKQHAAFRARNRKRQKTEDRRQKSNPEPKPRPAQTALASLRQTKQCQRC